jgi:hypothetical protein
VAVVPALTVRIGKSNTFDVDLYRVNLPKRRIVGLVPSQYVRVEPYATFLAALEQAGSAIELPPIKDIPPFLKTIDPVVATIPDATS